MNMWQVVTAFWEVVYRWMNEGLLSRSRIDLMTDRDIGDAVASVQPPQPSDSKFGLA
jgi:hypothetical protein